MNIGKINTQKNGTKYSLYIKVILLSPFGDSFERLHAVLSTSVSLIEDDKYTKCDRNDSLVLLLELPLFD